MIFRKIALSLFFLSSICASDIQPIVREILPMRVVEEKSYPMNDRTYTDVVIQTKGVGKVRFTVSTPQGIDQNLPCIIILAGVMTRKESLKHIPNHGPFAVIAYQYPENLKELKGIKGLFHLPSIRESALSIPAQIIAIALWAERAPFSDHKPPAVMGFSFGALFMPAIYHLAEFKRFELGPGVIGYGGAGLYHVFYANFPGSSISKTIRAIGATLLFHPLEPEKHIEEMKGNFLIINGKKDRQIPYHSAKKLQEMMPEPKTIMNLDTPHLQPGNQELLDRLIQISQDWLGKTEPRFKR